MKNVLILVLGLLLGAGGMAAAVKFCPEAQKALVGCHCKDCKDCKDCKCGQCACPKCATKCDCANGGECACQNCACLGCACKTCKGKAAATKKCCDGH